MVEIEVIVVRVRVEGVAEHKTVQRCKSADGRCKGGKVRCGGNGTHTKGRGVGSVDYRVRITDYRVGRHVR